MSTRKYRKSPKGPKGSKGGKSTLWGEITEGVNGLLIYAWRLRNAIHGTCGLGKGCSQTMCTPICQERHNALLDVQQNFARYDALTRSLVSIPIVRVDFGFRDKRLREWDMYESRNTAGLFFENIQRLYEDHG